MKAIAPRGRARIAIGRIVSVLFALPLCCAVAHAEVAQPPGAELSRPSGAVVPVAVGARLERVAGVTRLTFDLSAKVTATSYLLEQPDRVIVDLPQTNFQLDPSVGHPRPGTGGLVKSFRFGLFAPGRSRIVIDLAGPAVVTSLATSPIANGDPSRLTIELARSDPATFQKAAAAAPVAEQLAVPVQEAAQAKPSALPVIVIDPGHGGIDPGATGNGVVEKNVVLDFASTLAAKLTATGAYTVVMTRKDDTFISLGDRVNVARTANAALFVSIHADSLTSDADVTGSTVYIASKKASDAEAARVAQSENESDQVAGVDSAPAAGVDDILFDLTRRETSTYSHVFQRTLIGYWQKIAHLNHNPERSAGFKVLQAPDVPSVLLELGYLSSRKDVQTLTSPEWREQATTAAVKAIDAFFASRQPVNSGAGSENLSLAGSNPFGGLVRASSN